MRAGVDAFHAHDAFGVVEFLPWQIEYVDLHWAFDFAVWHLVHFTGSLLIPAKLYF